MNRGAKRLARWRAKQKLTQREVARVLDIATQLYSAYENGKTPGLIRACEFEKLTGGYCVPRDFLQPISVAA